MRRGFALVCILALGSGFMACIGCGRVEAPAAPGAKAGPAAQAAKSGAAESGAAASKAAAVLKDASRYATAEVPNAGSLECAVVYKGDPIPEPTEVPVNIDVPVCSHKVFTENLFVDKATRGMKNVVVRLEGINRGKAPPSSVTVTNQSCTFVPHVSVAVKGTLIEVRNADPVLHSTHPYLGGSSFFNLPLAAGAEPPQGRPIPRTGLMEIKCDVHRWMQAYMYVHTNPYLGVTDAQGKLTIDGVPPGKHPYVVWHEQLGEKKGEVEITAGGAAALKIEYAAPN